MSSKIKQINGKTFFNVGHGQIVRKRRELITPNILLTPLPLKNQYTVF